MLCFLSTPALQALPCWDVPRGSGAIRTQGLGFEAESPAGLSDCRQSVGLLAGQARAPSFLPLPLFSSDEHCRVPCGWTVLG